jgi:hypothetical protein
MIWVFSLLGVLGGLLVVVLLNLAVGVQPACAALPPLSPQTLEKESAYIIVGTVKGVTSKDVSTNQGGNCQYVATVEVKKVEKKLFTLSLENSSEQLSSPDDDLKPGDNIDVHYWQAGRRPQGWTGPVGQSSLPSVGMTIRLFLTEEDDGFHLLEPNGWQEVQ